MCLKRFLYIVLIAKFCIPDSYSQPYEDYDLEPAFQDGKYGYIVYPSKDLVIDHLYDEAGPFASGLARVKKDGKYGFINSWGETAIEFIYEDAGSFYDEFANVKKDGMWGFIDKYGNTVIDFMYEIAHPFTEGVAAVMKNGKFGFIDKQNRQMTGYMFDMVNLMAENLTPVIIDNQSNILEKKDQLFVSNRYTYDILLVGSEISARRDWGEWSLYSDLFRKPISSEPYEAVGHFSEGLISVKSGDKFGFIDKSGSVVIDFRFDDAGYFSSGLANIKSDGKWGYINSKGDIAISLQYNYAAAFKQENAWVRKGNKIIPINTEGQELPSDILGRLLHFSEGLAAVNIAHNIGFIDRSGSIVIEPQFTSAGEFHSGKFLIWSEGMYRYIDRTGKSSIEEKFHQAFIFHRGAAIVWAENSFGYVIIDTLGRVINDDQFQKIRQFHEGLAAASSMRSPELSIYPMESGPELWGYINTEGILEIPYQYDYADDFEKGYAIVSNGSNYLGIGSNYYFIDKTGEPVSEMFLDIKRRGRHLLGERITSDSSNVEFAFLDNRGIVLSDWFAGVHEFENNLCKVEIKTENGVFGEALIDNTFHIVTDIYSQIEEYNNDLFQLTKMDDEYNAYIAFLDRDGKQTCDWFDKIEREFSPGYSVVGKYFEKEDNYLQSILNINTGKLSGKWYEYIPELNDGLAIVEDYGGTEGREYSVSVIDQTGRRLCDWASKVEELHGGFAMVYMDRSYYMLTKSGALVKLPSFYVEDITEDIALIDTKKDYKYVDHTGNVFADKWVEAYPFSEGMAVVRKKKSDFYGYINYNGDLGIDYQYTEAEAFSDGLAVVSVDWGPYGYIDRNGKLVIGYEFETAGNFIDGKAAVKKDSEEFFIDSSGKRIENQP